MWSYPERPRLEISPGFLLLAAALFWLDAGAGLLPWAVLACLVHEMGHVAAALVWKGRIRRISFTAVGAELDIEYPLPLSYERESVVALAGPAVNLLTGGLALALGQYVPAALSLGIGVFNLLPVLPLDGGRVVYDLLCDRLDPDWAERLLTASAGCLLGLLVGIGAAAAVKYANVTLLLTALWLLFRTLRRA